MKDFSFDWLIGIFGTPKSDDVIYEQPHNIITGFYHYSQYWPGFTIFILGFIISFDLISGKRGKAELARETGNTGVSIEKGEAVERSDWLERQERQKEKYDRHLWLTNSSFWRAAFAILAILPNFPCAWDMLGCALKYLKVQMFEKCLGQDILHLSRSIDDSTQLVSGP